MKMKVGFCKVVILRFLIELNVVFCFGLFIFMGVVFLGKYVVKLMNGKIDGVCKIVLLYIKLSIIVDIILWVLYCGYRL